MSHDFGLLRAPEPARVLAREIARIARRPLRIMEVCGSHSHAIARYGLRALLPSPLTLVPGPGCPVCVAPPSEIGMALDLAGRPEVTVATFGDLLRVRASGSDGMGPSLAEARAAGADVRVIHSAIEALELARALPDRQVVFLAIGFETTAPTVAATVLAARAEAVPNVSFLVCHKTMPGAMRALLAAGEAGVQAFLCPGHVSAVTGPGVYEFIPREFGAPCAIAGFEPADVLLGVLALVRMWEEDRPGVEVAYRRVVRAEGNARARALMEEVFEPCDAEWRGLGMLPGTGLRLRAAHEGFDAERRFGLERREGRPHPACRCGEILRGVATPRDCAAFGTACTPERALGPCMVSSEGACAAEWLYRAAVGGTIGS